MPRLTKKHLTPIQYPELRLIAMLGMGMEVQLAYSGDTDNIFKWICDNQDRFGSVDVKALARPKKPGRPGPLRNQTVSYIQQMQGYLKGEAALPSWVSDYCNVEADISIETVQSVEEDRKMTVSVANDTENFPAEWLTKAGTPDKRKAVVRAVLNGDMTLSEAIEKEQTMKYIPKTGDAAEAQEKPAYMATPSIKTSAVSTEVVEEAPEEVVEEVVTAPAKKVTFKKKSLAKKSEAKPTAAVDEDLLNSINAMKERINYVSSAITEIKQGGFERQQSLTEELLEIKNAVLFIINSVVLEEGSVTTLADIPTPDEY